MRPPAPIEAGTPSCEIDVSLGFSRDSFRSSVGPGVRHLLSSEPYPTHSVLARLVHMRDTMSGDSGLRLLVTQSLAPVRDAVTATSHRLGLLPDDGLFVGLLAAWVVFVATVTYLLLS
jgi:hypothetical protein